MPHRRPSTFDPSAPKQILLLVGIEFGYGRDVVRGVASYAREHHRLWTYRRADPTIDALRAVRAWRPDGGVVHLFNSAVERAFRRLNIPGVDFSSRLDLPDLGHVRVDDHAIGQTAAEHFLNRGFRHLAFVGYPNAPFSIARQQGFDLEAQRRSIGTHLFTYEIDAPGGPHWATEARRLTGWLRLLPRPIGILAVNDRTGAELTSLCAAAGLRIPEEAAVLVINNDDLLCQISDPPLSSVLAPMDQVGYEAGRMLDEMMAGGSVPAEPLLIPPLGVITRRSTDVVAVSDPLIATALTFIRQRACLGINVEDVLDHIAISRSLLEQKFRQLIGRTPLAEIRRVRVERAKELLLETKLPMPAIAQACGFSGAVRFSTVFRQLVGETPTDFRQQRNNGRVEK